MSGALVSALASSIASAQSGLDGGVAGIPSIQDWVIYGNPEIGIFGHSAKGSSTSTQITGPRVRPPNSQYGDEGTQVSAPERSRELVMSFLVGGTFGALTPGLDVPGRPRLFMEVNLSAPFGTETQLARRGNPGKIEFPVLPPGSESTTPFGERTLSGVGTQITAQQQGPQVHAGLGASFEFPIPGDQLIRIKPAVMYSRTIVDVFAQTRRAVRLNGDTGARQGLEDFRFILLDESRREVFHSAGPSVEIEYVPGLQWGPFSISLYARGHAAYSFTSVKTKMQQCNVSGGQPNECATWKYTQDPWAYRATAGVHLNWIPKRFW
ncbi:MAG: hypothetical protein U0900_05970 [Myxococcota bacterium]